MKPALHDPLDGRSIPALSLAFALALVLANRLHAVVCESLVATPCLATWPVSQMTFRAPPKHAFPAPTDLLVAAGCLLLLILALRLLDRARFPVWLAAGLGLALILGSTLTHGVEAGLAQPIAATDLTKAEYLDDAAAITDPLDFIRDFETVQPSLMGHSGTHPPGAVLFFYGLSALLPDPAAMGLAVTILAVVLTAALLPSLLPPGVDGETRGRLLFVFLLIPAVQIYYAASLDAVIAPLVAGCCLSLVDSSRGRVLASSACLLLVSTLTFTFVFVLPVLVVLHWRRKHGLRTLAFQLGALVAFWAIVNHWLGYSYVHSFAIASAHENPAGFLLLAAPGDYAMTRLEDVAEILLFLGPFAAWIVVRGVRRNGLSDANVRLAAAAAASLALVFLTGAYRTGETARGALYIYPLLILGAASEVSPAALSGRYGRLAALLFAQSLCMQLLGDFYW